MGYCSTVDIDDWLRVKKRWQGKEVGSHLNINICAAADVIRES